MDVELLLHAPQISRRITFSGHVYDTDTGLVRTIIEPSSPIGPESQTVRA